MCSFTDFAAVRVIEIDVKFASGFIIRGINPVVIAKKLRQRTFSA